MNGKGLLTKANHLVHCWMIFPMLSVVSPMYYWLPNYKQMVSVLSSSLRLIQNHLPNRKQMTKNTLQLVGRNRLRITNDSILGPLSYNICCDLFLILHETSTGKYTIYVSGGTPTDMINSYNACSLTPYKC